VTLMGEPPLASVLRSHTSGSISSAAKIAGCAEGLFLSIATV
jgi:hypothetical protein